MNDAKVDDRVTPENVAGLPIGTVVEWQYIGETRTATKTDADTWINDYAVYFDDAELVHDGVVYLRSMPRIEPSIDPIAAALAIYDAGGSRDEMAAALRGGR